MKDPRISQPIEESINDKENFKVKSKKKTKLEHSSSDSLLYSKRHGKKKKSRIEEKLQKYREDPIACAELKRHVEQYEEEFAMEKKKKPIIDFCKVNKMAVRNLKDNIIFNRPWTSATMGVEVRPVTACRPGSGGWPAMRQESISEFKLNIMEKLNHENEVRKRKEENLIAWYTHILYTTRQNINLKNINNLKEIIESNRSNNENAILNENNDLILYDNILENDANEKKKLAAIKIASWYKKILNQRRQKKFLSICVRMKMISSKTIQHKKEEIRRKCACRVLDIIKKIAQYNKIEKAVQKFNYNIITIQKSWKDLKAIREAQLLLLNRQFLRFENKLIKRNKTLLAAKSMGNGMIRDIKYPLLTTSTMRDNALKKKQQKRVKMDDENEQQLTAEQMRLISTLSMKLPKNIKEIIVKERMDEEIRKFKHKWDQYMGEKRVYMTQKPIDEARMRLLKHAGIEAESQVLEPLRPRLHVIQSINGLSTMIERGIQLLIDN